jgi:hypothetical protein
MKENDILCYKEWELELLNRFFICNFCATFAMN